MCSAFDQSGHPNQTFLSPKHEKCLVELICPEPLSSIIPFIVTPNVSDLTGVIVLTSFVCVCVCVLPLSQPNRQTYRLEFWHAGQVEEYLSQLGRSRS